MAVGDLVGNDGVVDEVVADVSGRLDDDWLAAALDRCSDLFVVIDADTTVRWASAAIEPLLGHRPTDVVGRSMAEYVHPDDLARAAEVVGLATAGPYRQEVAITPALYRIRHADGRWIELEVNASGTGPDGGDLLLVLRGSRELVLLDQLLEAVTGGAPLEDQIDLVLELGRWRHPTEGYAVLYDEVDGVRRTRSTGIGDRRLLGIGLGGGPTPWDRALADDERVVVEDLGDRAAITAEVAEVAAAAGFDALIAVPVRDRRRDGAACILVWATPAGPTVVGQRYAVDNMVRALSLILQWHGQVQELQEAAHLDALTGLANRRRFFAEAHELAEAGAAALYLDLDGFKAINDQHGHAVGDEVLTVVGTRLAEAVGDGGLLARVGGDEFAVLCPAAIGDDGLDRLAVAILAAVEQQIVLDDLELRISGSLGVAVDRGEGLFDLLERADRALLRMKADGKAGWRLAE